MEIVEGFKRFSKIYIDQYNFGYRVNRKKSDGKLFLRCYEAKCRGSGIYLTQDNAFNPKTDHNHNPNTQMISKWRFLQKLKIRVETEDKSLLSIYQEECQKHPEVEHPPFNRLKSTLWKRRQIIQTSERLVPEDSKVILNLFPFNDSSKGQLEQDFQVDGNIHLDDGLKAVPQIFTEFVPQFPSEGNIVEVVEGPKKFSRVLVDDVGYAYQQNKKRKDGTFLLRCHTEGCSGTGIFNPLTTIFQRFSTHFHHPNPNAVQKLRFLQKVKLRAENETTSLSTIYSEEAERFRGTPLPAYENIKSTLRKRRVAALLPNIPKGGAPGTSLLKEALDRDKQVVATHYIARKGMEVIEGPKRFSRIYIDDHSYCYLVNRKKSNGSLILRCHEEGCRGSGRFDPSDSVFHKMAKHSHYADPLLVTKWRFLHRCKKRAENEATPIKAIYEQESQRHPNCNLPSYKKIESTLQKRRKSSCAKGERDSPKAENDPHLRPEGPEGGEVQVEEVCHPEGNPRYFISPNISYEAPINSVCEPVVPTPIIVRTGKVPKFNFPLGKVYPMSNLIKQEDISNYPMSSLIKQEDISNLDAPPSSKETTKPTKKKSKKPKNESRKQKKNSKMRKLKSRQPRLPSDYTSKMDVMEGMKRFSKIFIDESHFIYQFNKTRLDGALTLKCYESGCRGSGLYFPNEEVFQRSAEHCHEPSPELVSKCRLLSSLKARAELEDGPLRIIYEEEVAKYPGISIPDFRQMESTLQKRRRAKVPREPQCLREAALQLQRTDFSKCCRGNFFRSFLSVEGGAEILVFVSPGRLEETFQGANTFHLETGFKVIPQGLSQVVMLHLVSMDHVFPVVYALMDSRSPSAFQRFFEYLKEEFHSFRPQFVSSDYDFEMEASFQRVFPGAIVSGSWFHYTQAIWRQLRNCGLAQVFFQDEQAKKVLKCAMALPLLPSLCISDGMEFLQSRIQNSTFHLKETRESLLKVVEFIRDEWLKRLGVNRFSVFGLDRKLNYDLEALHQIFIKKVGLETPSLIKFLEKLFQLESIIVSDFEQKLAGKPIRADKSRRCNENEKLLKELYDKLEASLLGVDAFLAIAASTVPRHCHHDGAIPHDEDDRAPRDPSDISESLPFCEIRVQAPAEEGAKGEALVMGGPEDGGALTLTSSDPQCPSEEGKEFTYLHAVWPPPVPHDPSNHSLPQVPPLQFSQHTLHSNQAIGPPSLSHLPQPSIQHISLPHPLDHHHNPPQQLHNLHHLPEPNMVMGEVRLVDHKSEVFLY